MSDQSDLYDTDIARWSERQAELLRRMGKGERVNDQVDWENVAEEIEDMGNNVVRGVASHLVQALLHDLKAEAWPLSREVPHWRAEARIQRDEARADYAPSMAWRDELKMDRLYRRALRGMPETIDEVPPLPVPAVCPVTLDELLRDEAAA
jgi:Domain of unknown function DUF29